MFRTPYFAKRLCGGSFSRDDILKRVKELYADSLKCDNTDFAEAVAESISDAYDFQRLSKRIGGGKCLILLLSNHFVNQIEIDFQSWLNI